MLQKGFWAAIEERDRCYSVIDALMPFLQVNAMLNQEIEQMEKAIASLTPFVQIAQIWQQDALMHEQALDNICYLMADPEFLVYWANKVWADKIRADGGPAMDWINDEFLKLFQIYDQRHVAAYGQHSPMWNKLQPKITTPVQGSVDSQNYAPIPPQFQPQPIQQQQYQAPPMPPVPGSNGMGGALDQLKQRIELMKSGVPDLGQKMQLAHASQRQAMNADIYI